MLTLVIVIACNVLYCQFIIDFQRKDCFAVNAARHSMSYGEQPNYRTVKTLYISA